MAEVNLTELRFPDRAGRRAFFEQEADDEGIDDGLDRGAFIGEDDIAGNGGDEMGDGRLQGIEQERIGLRPQVGRDWPVDCQRLVEGWTVAKRMVFKRAGHIDGVYGWERPRSRWR